MKTLFTILALLISQIAIAVPTTQPMHPKFQLLDAAGKSVAKSGAVVSTMRTCGTCHDTAYIATHSYHTQAGLDRTMPVNWLAPVGARHIGGTPATGEINCFICHMPAGADLAKELSRFGPDGYVDADFPLPKRPKSSNCAQCHSQTHTDKSPLRFEFDSTQLTTATTGMIFSSQRISESGMDIAGKDNLPRPFDVHAERLLGCMDCHHSLNNPAYVSAGDDSKPKHLQFDARRQDLNAFLVRPDHDFAKGRTPQASVGKEFTGSMRRCENCHNAASTHAWLPYADRHMQAMNCESCHIPQVPGAAIERIDATLVTPDGQPLVRYRGVEGASPSASSHLTGFKPILLPRKEADGQSRLTPHNLITSWYWVSGSSGVPIGAEVLTKAFYKDGRLLPELSKLLDANNDGRVDANELRLDSPAKVDTAAKALLAAGVAAPKIVGTIEPYSLHHGVATGEFAIKECSTCHQSDSHVTQTIELTDYLPGGVIPTGITTLVGTSQVNANGSVTWKSDAITLNAYVIGHHRWWLGEFLGIAAVALAVLGVVGHGGLRLLAAWRNK